MLNNDCLMKKEKENLENEKSTKQIPRVKPITWYNQHHTAHSYLVRLYIDSSWNKRLRTSQSGKSSVTIKEKQGVRRLVKESSSKGKWRSLRKLKLDFEKYRDLVKLDLKRLCQGIQRFRNLAHLELNLTK